MATSLPDATRPKRRHPILEIEPLSARVDWPAPDAVEGAWASTNAGQRSPHDLTSPDRPLGDDGSDLVDLLAADVPTPEQVMVDREEEQTLHDLLGVLDSRARFAVEQRFGLTDGRKRSYREVG